MFKVAHYSTLTGLIKKEDKMKNQAVSEVKPKKKGGENMKKVLLLTAAVALLAMPAFALTIKDTRHNLGSTGSYGYKTNATSEICVFCHTPHNTSVKVPLWNRAANATAYKMYTGSSTFNGSVGGNLLSGSRSRLCLNCHESIATTPVLTGPVNRGSVATTDPSTWANNGSSNNLGGKAEIGGGSDLSNDHPVGFKPNANGVDTLIRFSAGGNKIGGATNDAFPLYKADSSGDYYLECSSCHDPHSKGFRKFLRQRNDSSSLCLTCHTK